MSSPRKSDRIKRQSTIVPKKAEDILHQSYWQSPEAIALFIPIQVRNKKNPNEIDVCKYIEQKIIKLIGGYTKSNDWRVLVDDFDQK